MAKYSDEEVGGRRTQQQQPFWRTCGNFTFQTRTVATLAFLTVMTFNTASRSALSKREVGNQNIAADIYGLGVRVGFYLQAFAQCIAGFRTQSDGGPSVGAAAAITIAVVTSWLVLAQAGAISAAESVVIQSIFATTSLPASWYITAGHSTINTIPKLLMGLTLVFQNCAMLWFWAVGWKDMPILNTRNLSWLFVSVRIDHWVHKTQIFFTILGLLFSLCIFAAVVYLCFHQDFAFWDDPNALKFILVSCLVGTLVASIPFFIAQAEMTIRYNDLQPVNDLALPGQLIPFIVGLVSLFEALLRLFQSSK